MYEGEPINAGDKLSRLSEEELYQHNNSFTAEEIKGTSESSRNTTCTNISPPQGATKEPGSPSSTTSFGFISTRSVSEVSGWGSAEDDPPPSYQEDNNCCSKLMKKLQQFFATQSRESKSTNLIESRLGEISASTYINPFYTHSLLLHNSIKRDAASDSNERFPLFSHKQGYGGVERVIRDETHSYEIAPTIPEWIEQGGLPNPTSTNCFINAPLQLIKQLHLRNCFPSQTGSILDQLPALQGFLQNQQHLNNQLLNEVNNVFLAHDSSCEVTIEEGNTLFQGDATDVLRLLLEGLNIPKIVLRDKLTQLQESAGADLWRWANNGNEHSMMALNFFQNTHNKSNGSFLSIHQLLERNLESFPSLKWNITDPEYSLVQNNTVITQTPPKALFLHLIRFQFNELINDYEREDSAIEDMLEPIELFHEEQGHYYPYRPIGFLCHINPSKGIKEGHYITYLEHRLNHQDYWFLYNDSKVFLINGEEELQVFKETLSRNAIVILYQQLESNHTTSADN